ncbi:MAG: hypothetical protein ACON4O_01760 [Lentimonas sp.]
MNKSLPFVCLVLGVAVGWFLNKKPGTPLEASPSTAAAEVYPQNAKRALASMQGGARVVNESLVKDVSTASSFEDKDAKIDVLENSRSLTNTIEILKIVSQMSESELRASLSSEVPHAILQSINW